jgi:hypothetical protein
MWGMTISKGLDSLLATREGDACMKDTDHHMRHPRGHLADRTTQGTRGCAWRDDQFGRGQNTLLGWSDPTFARDCVAKVNRGSRQPNNRLRAVRACAAKNMGETGAEGRNYLLQLRLHHLLHLGMCVSLRKTRN